MILDEWPVIRLFSSSLLHIVLRCYAQSQNNFFLSYLSYQMITYFITVGFFHVSFMRALSLLFEY